MPGRHPSPSPSPSPSPFAPKVNGEQRPYRTVVVPSVYLSTNHGCRTGSSSELSTTLCIQNTHMRLDRVGSRFAATPADGYGLTRRRLNRDGRGTMGGESPSWTITEGFAPFQWSSAVFDQMFRCTEPRTGPRSNVNESPTMGPGGVHPPEPLHCASVSHLSSSPNPQHAVRSWPDECLVQRRSSG